MPPNDVADIALATAVVHKPLPHDSAVLHVQGAANYVDDIGEPAGTLHIAIGMADKAAGKLKALDLERVRAAPGVVAVLAAVDIPGKNDIAPVFADEPLFADREVMFHGQALFAVVARTRDEARRAARLARIDIEAKTPAVTIADALVTGERVQDDYAFGRGDAAAAIANAAHRLEGEFAIGGQEHFYLEGQASFAFPGEGDEMTVHASTQDPTEVQHIVARVLGVPDAFVTVETRRMGGGFGGKESQACAWAAIAALAARVTRRPCKVRLDRDDDFMLTGKRHDFRADWRVGYDDRGVVSGYDVVLNARCGCSADLSPGVCDRAMFHAGNGYWLPDVAIATRRLKTNTVSNTAFRGFGGPQGMIAIERVMDAIARERGLDPLDVRKANLLRAGAERTPYEQSVEDYETQRAIIEELEVSSDYRSRREADRRPQRGEPDHQKGYRADAGDVRHLVHADPAQSGRRACPCLFRRLDPSQSRRHGDGAGPVHQGRPDRGRRVRRTAQLRAHNRDQHRQGSQRLANRRFLRDRPQWHGGEDRRGRDQGEDDGFCREQWNVAPEAIEFRDGRVFAGNISMGFGELAKACRLARVQLSHAGYYKTPEIHWDRLRAKGRPFLYFAYGAACSEVAIDTLTGEMRVLRADLLHDVGASINPGIDMGQVEGAFIQGMGWLTTEELVYDADGRLLTHAPATYKIPVASDAPPIFNTRLYTRPNPTPSIYRSKAVGEPPLMHGISVYSAILDAVHATNPNGQPKLDPPCTPESILNAIASLNGGA